MSNDISVRQFLLSRGADPGKGIRWLAPALKEIDLRALINMERVIVHLSDLHIGHNDAETHDDIKAQMGGTAYHQARAIVTAMEAEYKDCNPKPIVVITGDLIDYSDSTYLSLAKGLLDELHNNGFEVIVTPGNHDYSDQNDLDNVSWVEDIPLIGTKIRDALDDWAAKMGNSPKHATGMTYQDSAYKAFGDSLDPYNYSNSCLTESWKDRGAAFGLTFVSLDANDKVCTHPTFLDDEFNSDENPGLPSSISLTIGETERLGVPTPWFLHNKYMRFAHGYIDAETAMFFAQNALHNAPSNKVIVCMHYWINYWIPPLFQIEEYAKLGVLNLLHGTPPSQLVALLGSPNNPNFSGYGTGTLWNEHEDAVSIPDSPEPVQWDSITKVLGACHLLLVGHRHRPNELQDLRKSFPDYSLLQDLINVAKQEVQYSEAQWRQQIEAVADDPTRSKLLIWYMNRLDPTSVFFPSVNFPGYADKIISILKKVPVNLDWDFKALYDKTFYDIFKERHPLAYYHEAGSPLPDSPQDAEGNPGPWNSPLDWDGSYPLNQPGGPTTNFRYQSWAELRISLQTGEVEFRQVNNS